MNKMPPHACPSCATAYVPGKVHYCTPEEEAVQRERAKQVELDTAARGRQYSERAAYIKARVEAGDPFTPSELRYAATARCHCGAGLAYPLDIGMHGEWMCSRCLTEPDAVNAELAAADAANGGARTKRHDAFPFMFYEIKSEDQPSARGATTRPQPPAPEAPAHVE